MAPSSISQVRALSRYATCRAAHLGQVPKLINYFRFRGRKNVCFIWIPKAAGTSVFDWLAAETGMPKLKAEWAVRGAFPQCGPVTFGHMSYLGLLNAGSVHNRFDKTAFKFAFVRDPFDRALSLYFYMLRRGKFRGSYSEFLKSVGSGVDPVGLYNSAGLSQCNPQADWLLDASGNVIVDRIFKVENFAEEVQTLAELLQIKPIIFRSNTTERPQWAEKAYSTAENVEQVLRIYQEDFLQFGYDRTPSLHERAGALV